VPSNILLLPKSPQIDILKRAALFITHNGMNSTSESIHYGIPMICLPQGIMTDQPVVAERAADDLGLGIRFNSATCTSTELAEAIKEVVTDRRYLERTLRLSCISRHSNGSKNGAKFILKLVDEERKKNL
jgi:UDP:flavonoid glycosyltransferase YjiC (YdhE family)